MRWLPILIVSAGCGRIAIEDRPIDAAPDAVPDMAIDADETTVDPCANTYTKSHGQSLYRVVRTAASWPDAERACEADGRGSHLVQLDNSPERSAVESFLAGNVAWMGISDRITDGSFVNVTGTFPQFQPWQTDDPSFPGPGCVMLDPVARTYHDVSCNTAVSYVCECDATRAKPGSF